MHWIYYPEEALLKRSLLGGSPVLNNSPWLCNRQRHSCQPAAEHTPLPHTGTPQPPAAIACMPAVSQTVNVSRLISCRSFHLLSWSLGQSDGHTHDHKWITGSEFRLPTILMIQLASQLHVPHCCAAVMIRCLSMSSPVCILIHSHPSHSRTLLACSLLMPDRVSGQR